MNGWKIGVVLAALVWAGTAWAGVTLQVTPAQGNATLEVDFGTARSLSPEGELQPEAVVRQVKLSLRNDSGRQYQLFQRVNGPWIGPYGKEIPINAVRFSISETQTGGTNRFPNPAPLSLGEQEIFLSDANGSAKDLVITYEVRLPPGQRAGGYRTTVSYRAVAQ